MLRVSWLATVLAALVLSSPVAADLAGEKPAEALPNFASGDAVVAWEEPPAGREATPERAAARVRAAERSATVRAAPKASPHLLVHVPRDLTVRAWPTAKAKAVGVLPSDSRFYGIPTVAWVEEVRRDARWGRVEIPYVWPRREGWVRIDHLEQEQTWVTVRVDLSTRKITVLKRGQGLFSLSTAVGSRLSPTPVGEYFVTDRIPFAAGSYLGSFAFGISGIQPHLPPGWSGGDQLAIHGTNSPWTIGTAASAGCLRVSETAIGKLKPLLRLGTPVIVVR